MGNIHLGNIVKSFFLGLFIGVILQFYDRSAASVEDTVLRLLASGSIGFLIGFVTEWLTSVLPIRLANARMYFFINNLIALAVTAVLMASFAWMTASEEKMVIGEFAPILLTVLGIVSAANLFDYWLYRRAQNQLHRFQMSMKDK